MELKFKLLILLFAVLPFVASATEYGRTVHRGFVKSQITALDITNKFGTIEINDLGGDSVTVTAVITIENGNEAKANAMLDLIKININRSGGLLKVETIITENFKTKQNFSIDYTINIPEDRDLTVANKFGDVVMKDLGGKGHFEIAYGNFTAGNLSVPPGTDAWLDLAYGKADIESVNQLNSEIRYSKLFVGEIGRAKLDCKYSGLNFEEVKDLQLESKYDGVSIGEVGSLAANSKYTNYKIEELKQNLVIDTQYGSVRVDEVSAGFSKVEITNSYGSISLGIDETDYNLDAECDYCDVKYPTGEFSGNRMKDNNTLRVKGTVGGTPGNRQVILRSRYGNIKLTE